jgi:hypothetical protein
MMMMMMMMPFLTRRSTWNRMPQGGEEGLEAAVTEGVVLRDAA